jgi:hypothetical protein
MTRCNANGNCVTLRRSSVVRYCDFWEFKNEEDNFAQHVDVSMIQVMAEVVMIITMLVS